MTSTEIYKALLRYKASALEKGEVGIIREFRIGTGFGRISQQRIDAVAVSCWPGKGIEVVAYEIKISRADFRNETKKPFKRLPALIYSHKFYFVAPSGIIPLDELPVEAGLLEVGPNFGIRARAAAPAREPMAPNWAMVAGILRRLSRLENEKLNYLKREDQNDLWTPQAP